MSKTKPNTSSKILKKLERLSLSNASLEYRLQSRKLGAKLVNVSALCKMMLPFASYGHCLSDLFCAVTALGRSYASMLHRIPAHFK